MCTPRLKRGAIGRPPCWSAIILCFSADGAVTTTLDAAFSSPPHEALRDSSVVADWLRQGIVIGHRIR
jgi:hypothetical protein